MKKYFFWHTGLVAIFFFTVLLDVSVFSAEQGGGTADTTRPILTGAKYLDENPKDGRIDTIALTFSEKIKYPSFSAQHWNIDPGEIPGLAVIGLRYTLDDTIKLAIEVSDPSYTGPITPLKPTISSARAAGVTDSAGNMLVQFTGRTIEDGAAPFITEAVVFDTDVDGHIDEIGLAFSEPMYRTGIEESTFKGYWMVSGSDFASGAFAITELSVPDNALIGKIRFAEPSAFKTDLGNLHVTFEPGNGQYKDAAGNALAAGTISTSVDDVYPVLKDSAAPVVVTTEPAQNAKNVPLSGKITAKFSEPMNPGTVSHAVLNDYKTAEPTWSENNTVATWVYTGWPDNHALVFYITAGVAQQGIGSTDATMLMGGKLPYNLVFHTAVGAATPPPPVTPSKITGTQITINKNESSTFSQGVVLTLNAANAEEMQLSHSSDFSGLNWMPYSSTYSWSLTSGTGSKKVCVRFRNPAYTTSSTCDSITLKAPPAGVAFERFSINDDATKTHAPTVVLTIKAQNAKSMRIRNDNAFADEPWKSYSTTVKSWNLAGGYGKRTVYIQFLSKDGIVSNVYSDDILYTPYVPPPPGVFDKKDQIKAGELIKLQSDNNAATTHDNVVYYYGSDGKRYTFQSEKVFFSWFPNFAGLKELTPELMSSIPLGGNMQFRPGTYLIKSSGAPRVYAITPGGVLRPIKNEKAARRLFGNNWMARVVTISEADLLTYDTQSGAVLTEESSHPEGAIIEAEGKRYYMGASKLSGFTSTGFADNHFQSVFLVKLGKKPSYSSGSSISKKTTTHSRFHKKQKNGKVIAL